MIIGRGMIAKAFSAYESSKNIVVFASGVSNSKETNNLEFKREEDLIINTLDKHHDKTFIYFSTCSIEDKSLEFSKYVIHKKEMESLISRRSESYFIFRLSQVVGVGKSPTIVNFFIDSILNNYLFEVYQDATRNIIDVDDVFIICSRLIKENKHINETVNIASPFNIKVIEIINIIEDNLNKKANIKFSKQGEKTDDKYREN
jgi:UDP-2-acetamido-2,6-beta-L-arabino-hexul-4-ose reductase